MRRVLLSVIAASIAATAVGCGDSAATKQRLVDLERTLQEERAERTLAEQRRARDLAERRASVIEQALTAERDARKAAERRALKAERTLAADRSTVPGEERIVIAVAGPMTGSAASFGELIRNAAYLKVKEVNAAGGIEVSVVDADGNAKRVKKKIHLQVEDDKGDSTEAVNVARKLAGDKSVRIVVGHFNSSCTNAAKEVYNRKGVVEFSPGSTNVSVCRGSPWTFRNVYVDDYQGRFLAHYALKKLRVSRAAVLHETSDYGTGLMKAFVDEAEVIGLEIVGTEPYFRMRTADFKPLLQKVKASNPETIFVAGLYNEGALIAKAARVDLGMNVTILGGDGLMHEWFIKVGGKAAEGAYITTPFLFGTGNDSDAAKRFAKAYRAAYDSEAEVWGAQTYDAVGMAIEAIRAVGPDRAAIRGWFASITNEARGYRGVTGNTYFDGEGDCHSKPAFVVQVKNGKFTAAPVQMTAAEMEGR